jgi:ubiquinone/menaquinone biosynthesis C-methylase UbiE
VLLATSWAGTQQVQTAPPPTSQTKIDPKINDRFKKPNVKEYVKKFESEDREIYVKRHEITRALGLAPGMAVADVGAGTGLFTRLFAEQVGSTGKVYAVDISPRFLEHIAADAKKRRLSNVTTVLGTQDATNLPAGSVDLVFICDVYHHLEQPEKTLASIRRALKPQGNLAVIEFDKVEGRSSAFVLKHVRASKDVFLKEVERAGFTSIPTPDAPGLKENFFVRFKKTAAPPKSARRPSAPSPQSRLHERRPDGNGLWWFSDGSRRTWTGEPFENSTCSRAERPDIA